MAHLALVVSAAEPPRVPPGYLTYEEAKRAGVCQHCRWPAYARTAGVRRPDQHWTRVHLCDVCRAAAVREGFAVVA